MRPQLSIPSQRIDPNSGYKMISKFACKSRKAPRSSSSETRIHDALVSNLKEQITCLELENKYLKEKDVNNRISPKRERSNRSTPSFERNDTLYSRAAELEDEVEALRIKFTEREKDHNLEIARLKSGEINTQAAGIKPNDIERMRDLHAKEVVMLQKTIERQNAELRYIGLGNIDASVHTAGPGGESIVSGRDVLAMELSRFKDKLRNVTNENECLQKQYDELIMALQKEQEMRRSLENCLSEVQKGKEALEAQLKQDSKISTLEAKLKEVQALEVSRHYEMQRAKAAEEKLIADLDVALKDKLSEESKCCKIKEEKKKLEDKCSIFQSNLIDCQGERDYLRLQYDRLTTENKMNAVKIHQLETKNETDRRSVTLLEKQCCDNLDELEIMRRKASVKDDCYRELENADNDTRKQNYILRQERDTLLERISVMEEDYKFMSRRYEAVRHIVDQVEAEGQIRSALSKLGRTKQELQNLLQTQMHLSNELCNVMCDIPDLATVAGAIHSSLNRTSTSEVQTPQWASSGEQPNRLPLVVHTSTCRSHVERIKKELETVQGRIREQEAFITPILVADYPVSVIPSVSLSQQNDPFSSVTTTENTTVPMDVSGSP
eukprot:Tbor_TRINITY_DN6305_c0_g1::TRINITY_DN6305_c0_g1_i1::g.17861::m.17861